VECFFGVFYELSLLREDLYTPESIIYLVNREKKKNMDSLMELLKMSTQNNKHGKNCECVPCKRFYWFNVAALAGQPVYNFGSEEEY